MSTTAAAAPAAAAADGSKFKLLRRRLTDEADVRLASRVLVAVSECCGALAERGARDEAPKLHYETRVRDGTFVLHINNAPGATGLLKADDLSTIARVSRRVLDVRVALDERALDITVARSSASGAQRVAYTPAAGARLRRALAIDYSSGGVTNADDCATLDALIDAVYASVEHVPADMGVWYERVTSDDDASESVVGEPASSSPVVGYSVCFVHVPVVTCALFEHLRTTFPAALVNAYVYLAPPAHVAASALCVLNVLAADADAHAHTQRVRASVPRGLGEQVEPVRKRARR